MSKIKQKKVTAAALINYLKSVADPDIASHSKGFFKTAEGEYGEGDKFLGLRVPVLRKLVKDNPNVSLVDVELLLHSSFHEVRLLAMFFLVALFKRGDNALRKKIYELYLANTEYVNGWDLVDSSAHLIVGPWLEGKSHRKLVQLAKSKSLWERRIAMMATFHYIRQKEYDTALTIAQTLLQDEQDLMHKSVGWMLREIGNRDRAKEEEFLLEHYQDMPRTMLRYAIEKFPERRRQQYLKGKL